MAGHRLSGQWYAATAQNPCVFIAHNGDVVRSHESVAVANVGRSVDVGDSWEDS